MGFDAYCDGTGIMVCYCGGDFCVCGMDQEPCYGCEKCDEYKYENMRDYEDADDE